MSSIPTRNARGLAAALMVALSGSVMAQGFPSKFVTLIVPYAAGGGAELVGRVIAQGLSEEWKQSVIIENKPGAGTTIGAAYVAKAPPDGYTLYLASSSLTSAASLYKDLPYDTLEGLAQIGLISSSFFVLGVRPSLKVESVKELVALAKARPKALNFGSPGNGTGPHFAGELFRTSAAIDVVHVPFKGAAPMLTALLGEQLDYCFADFVVLPHLRSGKVKALAVTSARRTPMLPDVPTMAEAGITDYETSFWMALLGPAGTPRNIVVQINASLVKILKSPDLRRRLADIGHETRPSTPDELKALMASEIRKYAALVRASHIKVD
jgi:tripartite-type tricarboxylate transporter receptor subunit TctC